VINTNVNVPVITIDGPSGVGKGTISLKLAKHLGWHILDSGAMYRVLALAAQHNNVSLENSKALAVIADDLNVQFEPELDTIRVILAGTDVSLELRSESCGAAASQIATQSAVRQALLARQRAFRQAPGLIADGRDMGTVIFPDAQPKIFLTASVEERTHRRYKQLKEKGIDAKLSNLKIEIAERDKRDSTRTVAPLTAATDALTIDTTGVSVEKVMALMLSVIGNIDFGIRITENR
jgi:cytidylate kinase